MKTNTGKMLGLGLMLVLVLTSIGCLRPVDMDEGLAEEMPCIRPAITAEELVQEVIRAQHGMKTFRMEMVLTTTIVMELDGEVVTDTMDMETTGAFDLIKGQSKTLARTSMPMDDGTVVESEAEAYLLDGVVYTKAITPGVPPMWIKMEMPVGALPTPAEQMILLLEASEVEILGIEKINGISCYAIKVIPDMKVFSEVMMQQMGAMFGPLLPPEGEAPGVCPPGEVCPPGFEGMFDEDAFDITIRQWICRDTFFVVKENMEMTMTFEGMTSEAIGITWYYDHNEPVVIELPALSPSLSLMLSLLVSALAPSFHGIPLEP
ncbi:hypothetical protein M1N79_01940, partial [Dehalococcoidia bacterium]|nr:hypothetical protein [Dehalococcoidia bacterium]